MTATEPQPFPRSVTDSTASARPAADRRAALEILAAATRAELSAAWEALADRPGEEVVRQPEIGLVMVRGRIGGGGAPFNVGEATVSRAAVRLETGEVGFGHVLGRDRERALLVARFDALFQSAAHRAFVESALLAPVGRRRRDADDVTCRKTAATRVNFFTMVRGEDT